MSNKRVRDLSVGDVVLGIGSTVFTQPVTVTEVNAACVIGTGGPRGGSIWPLPMVGNHTATVA
jgi:hypothetical protein